MSELIENLRGLGISYYGDESRILIWVMVKSVTLNSVPVMVLIQDDAIIKIEDLFIAKKITIVKAGEKREILLGKDIQIRLESPYLFIDYQPEPSD